LGARVPWSRVCVQVWELGLNLRFGALLIGLEKGGATGESVAAINENIGVSV